LAEVEEFFMDEADALALYKMEIRKHWEMSDKKKKGESPLFFTEPTA
jgi:hypothetical protein